MAKLTLSSLLSSFAAKSLLNNNFQAIEDELNNKVLYRDNPAGEPNQMENVLDMNSNRIINVAAPIAQADALRLADIPTGAEQTSASFVDLADSAGYYDQTTVEGALQEIWDDLGNTATGEGASRVAIEDSGGFYSGTTVEDALQEVEGNVEENVDNRGFAQQVDSVAALRAASFNSTLDRIWLSGFTGVGAAGGGPLYRDSTDTSTADNGGTVFVDNDGVRWKASPGFVVAANTTIGIPTDYPTIQDAIDALSDLRTSSGIVITLNIETGHSPSTNIFVKDGDYSRFLITSDDAEVTLDAAFTGVWLKGEHAIMPRLGCLINQGGLGGNGVEVVGSVFFAEAGAGLKNAGNNCLRAEQGSRVHAGTTIWTGAGHRGAWFAGGVIAHVSGSDFSDSTDIGLRASRGCSIAAASVTCNDCGNSGAITAVRSLISATDATVERAGEDGLLAASGGHIVADGATVLNATRYGANANQGGHIYIASAASVTGSGTADLHVTQNGIIFADTCATTNGVSGPDESDLSPSFMSPSVPSREGTIWTNDIVQDSGKSTVTSGNTSVLVSTGLTINITDIDVQLTPLTDLGIATEWWATGFSGSDFTIQLDADPGTSVTFAWRAHRTVS